MAIIKVKVITFFKFSDIILCNMITFDSFLLTFKIISKIIPDVHLIVGLILRPQKKKTLLYTNLKQYSVKQVITHTYQKVKQ